MSRVVELIERLPKRNIVNLMLNALDSMQGYNGQSIGQVLCEAVGAEAIDDYRWRLPSIAKAREATESCHVVE